DSLVASAARLLAAGDPLGALKRVARRTTRQHAPCAALRWPNSATTSGLANSCDAPRVVSGARTPCPRPLSGRRGGGRALIEKLHAIPGLMRPCDGLGRRPARELAQCSRRAPRSQHKAAVGSSPPAACRTQSPAGTLEGSVGSRIQRPG